MNTERKTKLKNHATVEVKELSYLVTLERFPLFVNGQNMPLEGRAGEGGEFTIVATVLANILVNGTHVSL